MSAASCSKTGPADSENGHAATNKDDATPAAFAEAGGRVSELVADLANSLKATLEQVRLSVRNLALLAVLVMTGVLAVVGVVLTATVLTVIGLAQAVGVLCGHRPWLGDILVGSLVLGILAAIVIMTSSGVRHGIGVAFDPHRLTKTHPFFAIATAAAAGFAAANVFAATGKHAVESNNNRDPRPAGFLRIFLIETIEAFRPVLVSLITTAISSAFTVNGREGSDSEPPPSEQPAAAEPGQAS